MHKWKSLLAGPLLLLSIFPASAGERQIIKIQGNSTINDLVRKYGLLLVDSGDGRRNLFLVEVPEGPAYDQTIAALKSDPAVADIEANVRLILPDLRTKRQSSPASSTPVFDNTPAFYYGGLTTKGYVNQPAAPVIRLSETHNSFATGAGTVAVIDTGIDSLHPALSNVMTDGWDFTTNSPGGKDSAEPTPILNAFDNSLMDDPGLDQSTTPILDTGWAELMGANSVEKVPPAYGHGTMVAGLIHLVAPTAKLMPLRVFRSDGSATVYDVARSIYWAVDHGANVINMSFSLPDSSRALAEAVDHAISKGIPCVASAGNDSRRTVVYPAGYKRVIAVASTNNQGIRSDFSNYGNLLVTLAAPGEALVTTYPGMRYAAVWGTSFSTPQAAGAVALLYQINRNIETTSVDVALARAKNIGQELGAGLLDLFQACSYWASQRIR
jgi:subtilisin family serine protease